MKYFDITCFFFSFFSLILNIRTNCEYFCFILAYMKEKSCYTTNPTG